MTHSLAEKYTVITFWHCGISVPVKCLQSQNQSENLCFRNQTCLSMKASEKEAEPVEAEILNIFVKRIVGPPASLTAPWLIFGELLLESSTQTFLWEEHLALSTQHCTPCTTILRHSLLHSLRR